MSTTEFASVQRSIEHLALLRDVPVTQIAEDVILAILDLHDGTIHGSAEEMLVTILLRLLGELADE